ncbi:MAG: hypothetical protein JSV88_00720 [Candidatus Aminicenantes bacterium]|nr:MAG: hypothetical protein JSV88_00720 [Candidatus Aminicenantes bacterium]
MNKRLKSIIGSIQQLPIVEQLELMQMVSQSLYLNYQHTLLTKNFKQKKTIKQLLKEQQKTPVSNLTELVVDFWPENESVDDFIEYTYQQREEDRLRG